MNKSKDRIKKGEKIKQKQSWIIIANLVLSIFAFAFLFEIEANLISGRIVEPIEPLRPTSDDDPIFASSSISSSDNPSKTLDKSSNTVSSPENIDKLEKTTSTLSPSNTAKEPIGNQEEAAKESVVKKGKFMSVIKSMFKPEPRSPFNIVKGLGWGMAAYGIIKKFGPKLGLSEEMSDAIAKGMGAGIFTYYAAKTFSENTFMFKHATMMGIGVGLAVAALSYRSIEYKTVDFYCMAWQAPVGGKNCEKCNDPLHECSEYRCRSLGQACKFISQNGEDICFWENPKDVTSPMIEPWEEVLTANYKYTNTETRPPSWGTEIQKNDKQCIDAFTPIEFGITTNKPAQCKISLNKNATYAQMEYYMGDSSEFKYNHSQRLNIPGPGAINSFAENEENSGGMIIENNGRYTFYIRCMTPNGYWNEDPYAIKLCVDDGPDVSPPEIIEFSIRDGQPVQFEIDKIPIEVYTNEPATCRWSYQDENFNSMSNNMTCARRPMQMEKNTYYRCSGELKGIKDRQENIFYFRCEDQPWKRKQDRNVMSQSKTLKIIGTQPLNINKGSIKPSNNETITGATTTVEVNIELKTEHGYKNGEAECYYSVNNEDNFVPFFETNSYIHKQRQDLSAGSYKYYFKCVDAGGNADYANTTFNVYVDNFAPRIVRISYDMDRLKIITDEDADCYYSNNDGVKCGYEIETGILMAHETVTNLKEHYATWDITKNYYIKCKDKNGKQPNPTECSAIVRPTEIRV